MTARSLNLRIAWISVLGLYLELLLIRWIGTEIRIFAYLQNTILVVCFLGLGIGLFTSRRSFDLNPGLLALTILAATLAMPATRSLLGATTLFLDVSGSVNIWPDMQTSPDLQRLYGFMDRVSVGEIAGPPSGDGSPLTAVVVLGFGLLLAFFVMLSAMLPFVPIGRRLGRLLDEHPQPILAYSFNVGGSLAGIWLFVGLSRLNQPPIAWFLVLALLCLPYIARPRRIDWIGIGLLAGLLPLVVVAQRSAGALETVWSPYQKLELLAGNQGEGARARYMISVNNTMYQMLFDLRGYGAAGSSHAGAAIHGKLSPYDVPGLLHPHPRSALAVGAGSGNDAAGMLRSGVERVTAVEIDPAILDLGRRYHPERPYDSPRVDAVNTDARSFFATTRQTYDVVAFGLLDSHTTTSLTNARLDHYVYTTESFERVRDLLNPGGIVCVLFYPLRPFIIDRIAVQLRDVFGHEPLAFRFEEQEAGLTGVLLVAGDIETAHARIDTVPVLALLKTLQLGRDDELTYSTRPATDDWPYLYLENPRVPLLFGLLAVLLGLLAAYGWKTAGVPAGGSPLHWGREGWHFSFLGAGFLLLEVQNISKASVVLGNTWLVNAVIISGVLSMILAANAVVIRWPRVPLEPVYGVLLATVIGLYFVDLARFAFLPFAVKAAIVGSLTTLPMAFSGVAFARAFAVATRKDHALGANLIGALVGAVLESVSFLVGIRALLLLVALFYAAAMLTRPAAARRRIDVPAAA